MAKTILLADDSVTIRKVVELTFSDTDIRVESVGSGQEALDQFRAIEPDLVLVDVAMPEPSGYDICRQVKASDRPVPVLLLAGTFEPFDTQRARECGADGHVVKPFESGTLVDRVESLLYRASEPPAVEVEEPPAERDLDEALDSLAGDASSEVAESAEEAPSAEEAEAAAEATMPLEGVEPPPQEPRLTPAEIDAIARAVVERLSTDVLREIAWEVVPDLAETIIRERIRQLESEVDG
jgi:DNA-binding response OmpR family regulator